ncbi:MAG TPA: hypothetical protein VMU56_05780, partial [Beijerinckiaceae bacterium]|nr:hypothetical protein [Beijerinckiaceae bacterium]
MERVLQQTSIRAYLTPPIGVSSASSTMIVTPHPAAPQPPSPNGRRVSRTILKEKAQTLSQWEKVLAERGDEGLRSGVKFLLKVRNSDEFARLKTTRPQLGHD